MFWLKDNKIIVKDNKLVKCDNCPCAGINIILNAVIGFHVTSEGEEMVPGSVSINIQSASKHYSGTNDGMGVTFYNVPSDYPIKGELTVIFAKSCRLCSIAGFYGNHEGSAVVGHEDPNDRRNLFTGFKCTFEITKDTPIWSWPLQIVEIYKIEDNS